MNKVQRYISKELTHFVGKGKDETEQFNILAKIISSGRLKPHANYVPPNGRISMPMLIRNISKNELYLPSIVCFCDIPFEDIEIHMQKYSRFGLSFKKEFLIKQGATPVFYVSKKTYIDLFGMNISEDTDSKEGNLSIIWDNVVAMFGISTSDLLRAAAFKDKKLDIEKEKEKSKEDISLFRIKGPKPNVAIPFEDFEIVGSQFTLRDEVLIRTFLSLHVFNFLKFFYASKSDDDPENYYLEREWRVLGHVEFNIDNIATVIIPKLFSKEFRKEFPTYEGQLLLIE